MKRKFYMSLYKETANGDLALVDNIEFNGKFDNFEFIIRTNICLLHPKVSSIDFDKSYIFMKSSEIEDEVFIDYIGHYLAAMEQSGNISDEFLSILNRVGYRSFYDTRKYSMIQNSSRYVYTPVFSRCNNREYLRAFYNSTYSHNSLEEMLNQLKSFIYLLNKLGISLDYEFTPVLLCNCDDNVLPENIMYANGSITLNKFLSDAEFEGLIDKEFMDILIINGYIPNKNNLFMNKE